MSEGNMMSEEIVIYVVSKRRYLQSTDNSYIFLGCVLIIYTTVVANLEVRRHCSGTRKTYHHRL